EIRNVPRVAAALAAVGRVGKQGALRQVGEQAIRRRIGALHLVEHDALEGKRRVDALKLVMPALLREHLRGEARMEYRIQIDVDQIVEIREVLARERIGGAVG